MVVFLPDQCVGNLMKNRIADIFGGGVARQIERDGDHSVVIVAASGTRDWLKELVPLQYKGG